MLSLFADDGRISAGEAGARNGREYLTGVAEPGGKILAVELP